MLQQEGRKHQIAVGVHIGTLVTKGMGKMPEMGKTRMEKGGQISLPRLGVPRINQARIYQGGKKRAPIQITTEESADLAI